MSYVSWIYMYSCLITYICYIFYVVFCCEYNITYATHIHKLLSACVYAPALHPIINLLLQMICRYMPAATSSTPCSFWVLQCSSSRSTWMSSAVAAGSPCGWSPHPSQTLFVMSFLQTCAAFCEMLQIFLASFKYCNRFQSHPLMLLPVLKIMSLHDA